MAEAKQYTAYEAMKLFQVDDPNNHHDEDENVTAQRIMQASLENSNSSDIDSDVASKNSDSSNSDSDDASKNSDLSDSKNNDASDLPVLENADEGQPLSNQQGTLSSTAGIT